MNRLAITLGAAIIPGAALLLALGAAEAASDSQAVVTLRGVPPGRRGHGMGDGQIFLLDPNPLVLASDRETRVQIQAEPGLLPATSTLRIEFLPRTPFTEAMAEGPATTPIALGVLADPAELGRYPYAIRIQDETGAVTGEARGTVEVCETRSLPRPALMAAAAVGFLFLLANYAERRPLTRSYEPEH
jgi:hypothetical protein